RFRKRPLVGWEAMLDVWRAFLLDAGIQVPSRGRYHVVTTAQPQDHDRTLVGHLRVPPVTARQLPQILPIAVPQEEVLLPDISIRSQTTGNLPHETVKQVAPRMRRKGLGPNRRKCTEYLIPLCAHLSKRL